jgi:hypothetical protein
MSINLASLINAGGTLPNYDSFIVDETNPDNVVITYKQGGVTIATKTIAVSGAITTITIS